MKKIMLAVLIILFAASYFATERKRFTKSVYVEPGKSIELVSEVGLDVKMKSWDKDSVYIDLYVKVKSSEKEYEKLYIEEFEIDVWENSYEVEITIEDTDEEFTTTFWDIISFNFDKSVEVNVKGEIFVPKKNPFLARVRYSEIMLQDMREDLTIEGRGNELKLDNCSEVKKIKNEYGNINIRNTQGDELEIISRSSTVTVENHKGDLVISAPYSNITAFEIEGKLDIDGRSGEIGITSVSGNLDVDSDYSNIEIEDVEGKSVVSTRSSKVRVKNVAALKFEGPYSNLVVNGLTNTDSTIKSLFRNRSGKIYLSNVKSSIEIDDGYSEIKLREVEGDVKLSSRSNSVIAENITGNWSSTTEYCKVELRNVNSEKLFIKNRSGKVDVEFLNVPSDVQIENQYESVSVIIPGDFEGRYELECKYGEVRTDFAHSRIKGETTSIVEGNVGEAENILKVKNRSGNISLRKSKNNTE